MAAIDAAWPEDGPLTMHRDGVTVVFDEKPVLLTDRYGNITGIDAMVRAFRGSRELRIDPHRRFYNPPLLHEGAADPLGAYRAMLFDSIRDTPAPQGWRTKGTVDVFFASTADAYFQSSSTTYATARAGTGTLIAGSDLSSIGRAGQTLSGADYFCYESLVSFDTSSIDDAAVITDVALALSGSSDQSATDFVIQARLHDWGASVTTADWVAGADLSSKTLLATWNTSGYSADYNTFTSETAFISNVSLTGTTYILLCSKEQTDNSAPTGNEYVDFNSANTSGTSQDPKLTVTYSPVASATGAATLPRLRAVASGHMDLTGTAAMTLPRLTATAGIGFIDAVGGTVVSTLPRLTASATGVMQPMAEGEGIYLPRLTGAGVGVMQPKASGVATLPRLTAEGYAAQVPPALVSGRGASASVLQPGSGTAGALRRYVRGYDDEAYDAGTYDHSSATNSSVRPGRGTARKL